MVKYLAEIADAESLMAKTFCVGGLSQRSGMEMLEKMKTGPGQQALVCAELKRDLLFRKPGLTYQWKQSK
jgi:hypothetical protein